ncbi:MAG TPA: acyltransferase [Xanthobacteraceae bacterium]|nr:acyltransferase [Xanthobacteraceae bacterium]
MKRRLISIQYLRALAAILVVFRHSLSPSAGIKADLQGLDVIGPFRVDLFFIISGFVIFLSTCDGRTRPVDFIKRRLIRVVPMYWFVTLFLIFCVAFLGLFQSTTIRWQNAVMSLLFIPHFNFDNGEIYPLIFQGWTLNYEILFYLIFGAALAVSAFYHAYVVLAVLMLAVAAGAVFEPSWAAWQTYTSPLLLECAAGMGIAWLYVERRGFPAVFWCFVPLGVVLLAMSTPLQSMAPRVLLWGIPICMIVIGAIALETNDRLPDLRIPALLGAASYSIFLTHIYSLSLVHAVWRRLVGDVEGVAISAIFVLVSVAVPCVIGTAVYLLLEKPMQSFLARFTAPARAEARRPARTVSP